MPEQYITFLVTLLATFAITRFIVFSFPRKSLTHYLRHKTFLYIHHIYVGIILMAALFPIILLKGLADSLLIAFTIGLSLSLDEISAWISFSHYPEKKEFLITLSLYAIFVAYVLILNA